MLARSFGDGVQKTKKTRKAISHAGFNGVLAEKGGFEPPVGYEPRHYCFENLYKSNDYG